MIAPLSKLEDEDEGSYVFIRPSRLDVVLASSGGKVSFSVNGTFPIGSVDCAAVAGAAVAKVCSRFCILR